MVRVTSARHAAEVENRARPERSDASISQLSDRLTMGPSCYEAEDSPCRPIALDFAIDLNIFLSSDYVYAR